MGKKSTHGHSNGVLQLGNDEGKSDSVPVGDVDPVLLGDEEVLDDDGNTNEDRDTDGGVTTGRRDGKLITSDGGRDGSPCSDGGSAVLARSFSGVDARSGSGEEDVEADGEEGSNGRSEELSPELVLGLRAEQVTGLQVTHHVGSLGGGTSGKSTGDQVDEASGVLGHTLSLGDTSENKLRGLGDSGNGIDVGISGGLDTDEGEDEAENESKDGLATK